MQAGSVMGSQRFCLRWNNHQTNLLSVFDQLLHDEAFVDVTLAVEGQFLKAHKMVLSACSPYFQALFVGHPDKHPIVILKDVPYSDMRSLLDFMYRGEVSVDQDRLTAFLKVAESLRIKGLTEVNEERCDLPSIANSLLSQTFSPPPPPPPPPNLHRLPMSVGPPPSQPKSSGRQLPPPPTNPMLNSALTAPKRKRGRPRKLSGSSPNQPPVTHSEMEHEESKHQPPVTNSIENHLGNQFSSVSIHHQQHHGPPGQHLQGGASLGQPSPVAHPQEIPVNSFKGFPHPVPGGGAPGGGAPAGPPPPSAQPPSSGPLPSQPLPQPSADSDISAKMEEEDEDDDCEDLAKMEDGEDDGALDDEPPDLPLLPVKSEEPKPGTSGQDSMTSLQSSTQSDGERFSSSGLKNQLDSGFLENDEDSLHAGLMGNLEDMIACSPGGSSEGDETADVYSSHSIGHEFADEDMSQFEEDSLRSLMGQPLLAETSSNELGRRSRMDKMSIRKFCTREGDQIHRCTICSKAYTHISNFCRHFLSAHCGTKQEIHCPICQKPFTRKDNMMTHAKQVHGYTCLRNMMTDQLPSFDQQATE